MCFSALLNQGHNAATSHFNTGQRGAKDFVISETFLSSSQTGDIVFSQENWSPFLCCDFQLWLNHLNIHSRGHWCNRFLPEKKLAKQCCQETGALTLGACIYCKYPDWSLLCDSLRSSLLLSPSSTAPLSESERSWDLVCGEKKSILEKEMKYSKDKNSLKMGFQWERKFPGVLVKIIFINKGSLNAMGFSGFFL